MISRKLALSIATTTMALYGCGPTPTPGEVLFPERDKVCADGATQPCMTTVDAHSEQDRRAVPGAELTNETLTFVINNLSLPEAAGGRAAGFNLDGMDSGEGLITDEATCEQAAGDFESLLDDGHVGVDNALQGLLPTIESFLDPADCPGATTEGCLDATLMQQVNEGSVLLLVEVTGVDSYRYDTAIQMQLFRAAMAGSGACTSDAECTTAGETCVSDACRAAPQAGTDGRIAAGQTFQMLEALGAPVPGDIFDGRVRATTPLLTLQINAGEFSLPLQITNPEVRFDIATTGLANGQIGGVITTADIVAAANSIDPSYGAMVEPLLEGIADYDPSAADPAICDALSVGITFQAVAATRI